MKAPLPSNEGKRLETLRGYDVLDTPPEQAFDDLTLLAAQICQVPIALISLVDETRQWFKSALGVSATETSRDYAFCAHAILYSDDLLEVCDAQLDLRFADNPLVTADPHIRFYAGAPLVAPDGLALGTLCVIDRAPRVLNAEQRIALRALSHTVIVQLELRRSLAACREMKEQLESLNTSLEEKVAVRTAELQIAATAFEASVGIMVTDARCVIQRVNGTLIEHTGYTAEELIGQTPSLLKSGHHDTAFYAAMWESINLTGSWQGEIWDRRKNGEVYPKWLSISAIKNKEGTLTNYVGTQNDISERKAAESAIKNLAFNDPLTQLPNRRLLQDRLHQALVSIERNGRSGALLFLDLDNFKVINDTLGHVVGDMLLQHVADRLTTCVREGDTVARIGGDEFVVMLEDLSQENLEAAAQAEAIGVKILATLNQPYHLGIHEYHNTPSIGITLFNDHKQDVEELFKQADIAMYQAKKAGRNTLRFFDPQMQESISVRAALEKDLRNAIETQQFQLYYQIQIHDLRGPVGAEALIRWIHPERGLVYPADFITLAEETKLILPIGQWVLEKACAQLKAWERDALTCNLILSVNVSPQQFFHADFVHQVKTVIQRYSINTTLLKLELTESMLLEDIEDIISTMNVLKEIGVRISLDDFGTGYSSLQYLKKLPLNQLKIDRSFVRDIAENENDKAIVSTIIAMAHTLNLSVIAEGVETEEQRQILLNQGCTHFQGYLFSKPIPLDQFEELLKHR